MGKKNIAAVAVTAALICGTLYSVNAANAEPGSSADPVVTKSYVDEKISELMGVFNNSGNGNTTGTNGGTISSADKEEIVNSVMEQLSGLSGGTDSSTYKPVSAIKGQVIIGGEGSEIILRSGQAVGYCTGTDGIVNATKGTEGFNDTNIEKNNLLIVPRNDGRGVRVTTEEAWFIIKGSYQIVDLDV